MVAEACYDVFVWDDSGTKRATRGPVWDLNATITVTIATPAVVSWTAHGLNEGDPVIFTTSGALPTGITAGTIYYVSKSPAAGTFNISTTVANAAAGTLVNTSGTQSGVHTGTNRTRARGTAAALVTTKGVPLNNATITNGPAASRGTWVGTIRSNASSQLDWILGGSAAGGTAAVFYVWNAYNQVPISTLVQDSTDSWSANATTVRSLNNSITNRASFVVGAQEQYVTARCSYVSSAWTGGTTHGAAIAYDSTSLLTGIGVTIVGGNAIPSYSEDTEQPTIGSHYFQALDASGDTSATTTYGDDGAPTVYRGGMSFSGWM
jgi:F0F1-type ATP synthase membrane subunit c/vacuolar-type H+-ATPase subunit K